MPGEPELLPAPPRSSSHCPPSLDTRQPLWLWLQLQDPLGPSGTPVAQQPLTLLSLPARQDSEGGQRPGLGRHSSWGMWRSPERAALTRLER